MNETSKFSKNGLSNHIMIFNVCIDIINASSKTHLRIISKTPMFYIFYIRTLNTIMIIKVCIKIISVASMLLRCRIVVSLMNRLVFNDNNITSSMLPMCSQLDFGQQLLRLRPLSFVIYMYSNCYQ